MARAGQRPTARRDADDASSTRARVVAATVETLKRVGFAGASAREIATTGGFTQGVVFYHFGSMQDVLLAALDETSRQRLERYSEAVEGVQTLPELLAVAGSVFREDLEAGHVKVLSELVAAASSMPELGPAIVERIEPWIAFTEGVVRRVLGPIVPDDVLPARQVAYAVVALYLGLELLTNLDGDRSPTDALFSSADALAGRLAPLFNPPTKGDDDE